jgi:hypothetical protein
MRRQFGLDVPEAASLWPRIVARHEALFGAPAYSAARKPVRVVRTAAASPTPGMVLAPPAGPREPAPQRR